MRAGRALACVALIASAVLLGGCPAGGSGAERVSRDPGSGRGGAETNAAEVPDLRVLLTAASESGGARLSVDGAWQLTDLGGGRLGSGDGLRAALATSDGAARIGSHALPRAGGVLVPAEDGDLRVNDKRYPGKLRIARSVDGRYRLFVDTDLETYVTGVVPGEIPAKFPREAQRTQAILARTYAVSSAPNALGGERVLVADTGMRDQQYAGIPPVGEHRRIAADAASSTRGMILMDGSAPLRAWYHSTCGDHTCAADAIFDTGPRGPLRGVACGHCQASKYYRWSGSVPAADVVRVAGLTGRLEAFEVGEKLAGGRARTFRVTAGGRTASIDAAAARLKLGPSKLRSTWVDEARVAGGSLELRGRGWGHGVGLCQMGAKGLAETGATAESILTRYYPGAELRRAW